MSEFMPRPQKQEPGTRTQEQQKPEARNPWSRGVEETIAHYFEGGLSKDEERELLKAASTDREVRKTFIIYKNIHCLAAIQQGTADKRSGQRAYGFFMREMIGKRLSRLFLRTLRYAAVFAIGLLCAWWLVQQKGIPSAEETGLIAGIQEIYSPAGQRVRVTLPDGTKVWLNARSRLTYPSAFKGERKVSLEGEGWFEVAENPDAPFIVSTGAMDVKALGTQFDVRDYPSTGKIEVYLHEGSVLAYSSGDEESGLRLEPGQLLVERDGAVSLETMDPDKLMWREGIYLFKDQTLREIVDELQLYYDVRIKVLSPELLDHRYVGKFRQSDGVMTILRVLQKTRSFRVWKNDATDTVYISR